MLCHRGSDFGMENLDSATIFELEIEQLILDYDFTVMESVLYWCEQRGLEVEYAADLIKKNRKIRQRLKDEGESLKMIKRRKHV